MPGPWEAYAAEPVSGSTPPLESTTLPQAASASPGPWSAYAPSPSPSQDPVESQIAAHDAEQAQYGSAGQTALAGLAGAARGASFGASDQLLTRTGLVKPETLAGLSKANPIASTVGNIAGGAGITALTGGLAPEAAGLAKVAAMAAEGAAFGAGQAISDEALGDPELNGQKVLSHIGFGAALGGGLGLLGKAVESGAPAIVRKLKDVVAKFDKEGNFSENLKAGLSGKTPDSLAQDFSKNLEEMYSSAKKVVSETKGLPLSEGHEAVTEQFRKDFMKKMSTSKGTDYVVDPGKVASYLKDSDAATRDLRKRTLDSFVESSKSVADAAENHHGFKSGSESIASYIKELSDKQEKLLSVAKAANKDSHGFHATGLLAKVVSEAHKAVTNPYQLGKALHNVSHVLSTLDSMTGGVSKDIAKGAKNIFSSGAVRGAVLATPNSSYEKASKRVRELHSNPEVLGNHLTKATEAMYDTAPNISQSIQSALVRGVDFLESKLPKPVNELVLSSKWTPTNSQKAAFDQYYHAVNDPTSLLQQIKHGSLTSEALEAVATVHPQLLEEMRSKVMEHLDPEKARSLPYAIKISLSKFMQMPLEEALLPAVIASNQASFMIPAKPAQGQGGGMKKAELNTAGRSQSRATQLQTGDE